MAIVVSVTMDGVVRRFRDEESWTELVRERKLLPNTWVRVQREQDEPETLAAGDVPELKVIFDRFSRVQQAEAEDADTVDEADDEDPGEDHADDVDDEVQPVPDPGAGDSTRNAPVIRFNGQPLEAPGDLANAFAGNWSKAQTFWADRRANVLQWLRHDLGLADMADELADAALEAEKDPDARMMRIIGVLSPDLPPHFMDRQVDGMTVAAAAGQVLRPATGDAAWLLRLIDSGALDQAADRAAADPKLAEIRQNWRTARSRFLRLSDALKSLADQTLAPPDLEGATKLAVFGAAAPDADVLEALREQAREATSDGVAARRIWFGQLGSMEDAGPAEVVLISAMAPTAIGEVRREGAGRGERNDELLAHLGGGAGIGFSVGLVWLLAVSAYCGDGETCMGMSWPSFAPSGEVIVFLAASLIAGFALLKIADARTRGGLERG